MTDNAKLSPVVTDHKYIAPECHACGCQVLVLRGHIADLERKRDEYKQAGLDSIEAQDMWKEAAEAAEASLAQHVAELDKLNAANQAYRGEADSLKASLAQAQKERDELGRWKAEKTRICKELGLPEKVCLGEMITSLGEIHAQARREGMLEAAKIAEKHGRSIGENCWNHENRHFEPPQKGAESTCWQDIAAAIRRAAEEK